MHLLFPKVRVQCNILHFQSENRFLAWIAALLPKFTQEAQLYFDASANASASNSNHNYVQFAAWICANQLRAPSIRFLIYIALSIQCVC